MAKPDGIYRDGTYLEANPEWHEGDSSWKAGHIRAMIARNDLAPDAVAEIGCGAGEILNILHNAYQGRVAMTGFEISPQAFAICRNKAKPNLEFVLADPLREGEHRFDIVLAIDVMEHVDDYIEFLRRLKRIGRHVILHIPLDLSAQRLVRIHALLAARKHLGHLHYFTKETALATLGYAGHEVVDWFYTASALDLSEPSWRARLVNAPRAIFHRLAPDLTARLLGGFSIMVLTR